MSEPQAGDGPPSPFAAPWEARAFGLAVALRDAGHLSWPAFSERLGARLAEAPDHPYYERWLVALEDLLTQDGTVEVSPPTR